MLQQVSFKKYKIIHENYNDDLYALTATDTIQTPTQLNDQCRNLFNLELDDAVRDHRQYDIIIIEPKQLANRTLTWLNLGKHLFRLTNIMGTCCVCTNGLATLASRYQLFTTTTIRDLNQLTILFGSFNLLTGLVYFLSWNSDPCIRYRPCTNADCIKQVQQEYRQQIRTNKPFILLKNSNYTLKHFLNCTIFSASLTILTYRTFKLCFH